jgi:hypothetical protein
MDDLFCPLLWDEEQELLGNGGIISTSKGVQFIYIYRAQRFPNSLSLLVYTVWQLGGTDAKKEVR